MSQSAPGFHTSHLFKTRVLSSFLLQHDRSTLQLDFEESFFDKLNFLTQRYDTFQPYQLYCNHSYFPYLPDFRQRQDISTPFF